LAQIDILFWELVTFSPLMVEVVTVGSESFSFHQYINELKNSYLIAGDSL
jgi:hypothetical protein